MSFAIPSFYQFQQVENRRSESIVDSRSFVQKSIASATSVFRQVKHLVEYWFRYSRASDYHKLNKEIVWKEGSQGLCVFIHGLRSHPKKWKHHISLVKQKLPQVDIFAPFVPKQGLCSLKEATDPILAKILDYVKKNPLSPVYIFGHSNGARISLNLDAEMREKAPTTPVHISAIAGPLLGSSRMNLVKKLGIVARFFYPAALQREMSYESQAALKLLNRVKQPLTEGVAPRTYEFFASRDDFSIPDLPSTLPFINEAKRWICEGHSHDSIVDAVKDLQINSLMEKHLAYHPALSG